MTLFEFPASFAQRRMWLLEQLDPGRPTYNVSWAVWLHGELDTAALERAWAAAVKRHEALRTTFRDDGGIPVQVVDDEAVPDGLAVVSLLDLPEQLREGRARELIRRSAGTAFDFGRGSLLRTQLLRLSTDRHVLCLVAHHIIADGWSFRRLFDEIAADYQALRAGQLPVPAEPARPAEPGEPGVQYPDFTMWQHEHADAGGYADAEQFWRAELADAPPELALPVDYPYPAREGFAAAEVDVGVDASIAAALRQLASDRGTTLFTVLMAAYAILLSRYSGADDLLIGVPVAARTRLETESVVGLFANTLAIRVPLPADPTLGRLVDRVHAAVARAQAYQELPFARVVELYRPERHPARSPLVQVMCAMEEAWPVLDRGGLRWQPELVDNGTGKFELELTMADGPTGLGGRLRYRTDLFTPATAQRFADGLCMTLAALAGDAGTRVSHVDILPADIRELVTRVWPQGAGNAGPPAERPTVASATALMASACAGDRTVIGGSDAAFTGQQLRVQIDRIAAGLIAREVRVQDTVGILLPRGAQVLPALLGVWWVGAAYLPLDPAHPSKRIHAMLADAGVRVVITDRIAIAGSLLSELDSSLVVLDLAELDRLAVPDLAVDLTPFRDVPATAAAYAVFTSGSTGRPKAVTVTHGSLVHLLNAFRATVPIGPDDRIVAVTTFAFDIAVLELILPLLCGTPIVVADTEQAMDGVLLRRLLESTGATALQATPTTWRMLVDAGGVPAGVRLRLSGGEALPRDLAEVLVDGPGVRLWNLYGPTETTVWSTGGEVDPVPGPIDVGSAITGTQVYLLDQWMGPVAPGVVGEVYLGGAGVSRGYVGAPGLTAQQYLPDPFAAEPGLRLYRTGDVGRWRPTGQLELLGRVDRQVKVRGFRVETAEIEVVLRNHPDVTDAVVTTTTGTSPGDVRLVGYVVTGTGVPDRSYELREYLRHWLPDYMVPGTFVTLAELPRTPGGKIDHRALPEPRWGSATEPKIAPRTPLERELADLMAALLGLPDPVGALDNFFVLGGHSLTATQLIARVWTNYGVDLPVRLFFDDPTVAGLAGAITAAGSTPADEPRPTGHDVTDFLDTLTDQDVDALLTTMITDESS